LSIVESDDALSQAEWLSVMAAQAGRVGNLA
jgi:hypothetical protein